MDAIRFKPLFDTFEKEPFKQYLQLIMEPLSDEKKELLIIDSVSYTIGQGVEWFSAKFYLRPFCIDEDDATIDEEDRWIQADVIGGFGNLVESYSAQDPGNILDSLEACIDYYLSEKKEG